MDQRLLSQTKYPSFVRYITGRRTFTFQDRESQRSKPTEKQLWTDFLFFGHQRPIWSNCVTFPIIVFGTLVGHLCLSKKIWALEDLTWRVGICFPTRLPLQTVSRHSEKRVSSRGPTGAVIFTSFYGTQQIRTFPKESQFWKDSKLSTDSTGSGRNPHSKKCKSSKSTVRPPISLLSVPRFPKVKNPHLCPKNMELPTKWGLKKLTFHEQTVFREQLKFQTVCGSTVAHDGVWQPKSNWGLNP